MLQNLLLAFSIAVKLVIVFGTYGECGIDPGTGLAINRLNYTPARTLNTTSTKKLLQMCPNFVNAYGPTKTCCDDNQIETLISNFKAPENILRRCPSCLTNFQEYFCSLTCSSDQDQFMRVQSTTPADESHGDKLAITGVELLVHNSYVNAVFSSCHVVGFTATGGKALDLMCGPWGYKFCTSQRWFTYLGDYSNGYIPFLINVTYWNDDNVTYEHPEISRNELTYHPLKRPVVPCDKTFKGEPACSCSDCRDAC